MVHTRTHTYVQLHVSFQISTAGEFQVTRRTTVWLLREQNVIALIFLIIGNSINFRNAIRYFLFQL